MGAPLGDPPTIEASSRFSKADDGVAYAARNCPTRAVQFTVIRVTCTKDRPRLRCVAARTAFAASEGVVSPSQSSYEHPLNCLSTRVQSGAGTRMPRRRRMHLNRSMCRNCLMHVAVSRILSSLTGRRGITEKVEPWLDRINGVGSEANHELIWALKESAHTSQHLAEALKARLRAGSHNVHINRDSLNKDRHSSIVNGSR